MANPKPVIGTLQIAKQPPAAEIHFQLSHYNFHNVQEALKQ